MIVITAILFKASDRESIGRNLLRFIKTAWRYNPQLRSVCNNTACFLLNKEKESKDSDYNMIVTVVTFFLLLIKQAF